VRGLAAPQCALSSPLLCPVQAHRGRGGRDAEDISTVFKFATGHIEQIYSKTYGVIKVPRSISFAKLDETAFRKFFDACVDVALTEWGIEAEALADLLDPKTEVRA
jgi:hypothetical protein